jgi:DNA-directed RNA polymerase subunit M/transcription elongation factor TFIIS
MCSILYDSNIDKKNLKLISKLDIDEFVKEHVSPFNYTNYEFITDNKVDIKDNVIRYAESILERAHNQLKINNYVNNIYIAYKIETSVFEFSLIYCLNNNLSNNFLKSVYDDKINNIIENLNINSKLNNKTLLDYILNDKINPSYVAFLSPSQLDPEKWTFLIKKKEYREWRENNISYSDTYKCGRCGERKCKVSQYQTRGADEPMTVFVTCLICYNSFKFC